MIDLPDRDETLVSIFNPLEIDFKTLIRDDNNSQDEYTVPSLQIVSFPKYKADIIINKLLRVVQDKRRISYFDLEEEKKIREEIQVENG